MSAPNDKPRFARNINSGRPFRRAVWRYREKGWQGTLALPPKEKHPPPIGYTGRGKPYPDNDTISKWLEGDVDWAHKPSFSADAKKANIGLHLGAIESTELCFCRCKKCTDEPSHYHCKQVEPNGSADSAKDVAGGCYWGKKLEVVGIDVDDYTEGSGKTAKRKYGAKQLAELEAQLGALPPTWRSSAREGISGIRFFLVPAGLAYRGKAAEHIDIVCSHHKFAVVFPSYHPSGGQYVWYRPIDPQCSCGKQPGRSQRNAETPERCAVHGNDTARIVNEVASELGERVDSLADLPEVSSLPMLPDAWIDHLTRGRTRDEGVPMDMDTDAKEIVAWARRRFVKATRDNNPARFVITNGDDYDGHGLCAGMVKAVAKWKRDIDSDPSSHDKIAGAHWNLLRMGLEGHTGWEPAVKEVERYIVNDVRARNKRGASEVRSELYRSKTNALRKIKGEVDAAAGLTPEGEFKQDLLGYIDTGKGSVQVDPVDLVGVSCSCFDDDYSVAPSRIKKRTISGAAGAGGAGGAKRKGVGSGDVDAGSDGDSSADGDSSSGGVPGLGGAKSPGEYETNDDGNAQHFIDLHSTDDGPSVRFIADLTRTGTWMVWDYELKRWQIDGEGGGLIRRQWWLVKRRQEKYVEHLKKKLDAQINLAVGAGAPLTGMNAPTALVAARAEYQKWAKWAESSGNNRPAQEALKAAAAIEGVSCTRADLNARGDLLGVGNGVLELGHVAVLRDAVMGDLVTYNTGIDWNADALTDKSSRGRRLWRDFLDRFLPDPEVRRIAQIAVGSTIFGGNPDRVMLIFIGLSSTGKSTFSKICAAALGEYGGPIGKEAFQGHKFKPALTLNKDKRFVINNEFDRNVVLSTAAVKEVTGGDESPVESKGVDEVTNVIAQFVPGLGTNTMPRLNEPDTAIARRIYPIQFNQVISEDDPDLKGNFSDLLKEHALEVVFAWMVQGYEMYKANRGLVRNELTDWWRDQAMSAVDDISLFISECLIVADNMEDRSARWQDQPQWCQSIPDLYALYESWYHDANEPSNLILSKHKFSARLTALGFWQDMRRVDGKRGRWWLGVKIAESGRVDRRRVGPKKLTIVRKTTRKEGQK